MDHGRKKGNLRGQCKNEKVRTYVASKIPQDNAHVPNNLNFCTFSKRVYFCAGKYCGRPE